MPPEWLRSWRAGIRRILDREGTTAVWYGHASVGCLHIRPRMDLRLPGATASLRRIAEETADLVVGARRVALRRARGRPRPLRAAAAHVPPETIAAFGRLKDLLDPDRLLNPGVLTDPDPLDAGSSWTRPPPRRAHRTAMQLRARGRPARAEEACNGNGACRSSGTAMRPSYQALRDERHATRGRAVLLRAAIEGRLPGGLADDGLHEALELCLACKACATECPAQVDVARLKVEALAHRHRAQGVPLRARLLGHAHDLLALRCPQAAPCTPGRGRCRRFMQVAPPMPTRPWRPDSDPDADMVVMADTFTRYIEPGDRGRRAACCGPRGVRTGGGPLVAAAARLLSQGLVGAARARARRRSAAWRRTPSPAARSWCSSRCAGRCWWTTSLRS